MPLSSVNANNTGMSIAGNYDSYGMVSNSSLQDSQLFLKLLSVSMSNQDPMNPTDSSEFVNQMTQYAVIETLSSVKSAISDLTTLQLSMNMYSVFNNATSLVGKDVSIIVPKGTDGSTEDVTVSGNVEKVELETDGIYLVIDGKQYDYDYLKSINS